MSKSTHNSPIGSVNSVFSTTRRLSAVEKDALFTKFTNERMPSEPGNIIPHFWFKVIVDEKGRPDSISMLLLGEIFALYRFSNSSTFRPSSKNVCDEPVLVGKTLRTSYEHFQNKFGFAKEKSRRALVRLEKLGVIKRDVCNISLEKGRRCNKLMLKLDQDFFLSCFRNPDNDIRGSKKGGSPTLKKQKVKSESNSEHNNTENNVDDNKFQSTQISHHLISNKKYINKDRSTRGSNFVKNDSKVKSDSLEQEVQEKTIAQAEPELATDNSESSKNRLPQVIPSFSSKPKKLADFYPISQEDCLELQNRSGREFSLNAMNEILLDMSKRRNDRFFYSKKGFMGYMTKAYAYEKRDAVKTNNENFKIKANLSSEERRGEDVEKYLQEIEYSRQVSPEWHLKKKIASVLERNKAYSLLKAYRSIAIEDGIGKLNLSRSVDLTPLDISLVLAQIKATHERFEDGTITQIEKVEFILPKANRPGLTCNEVVELPNSLWGSIRRQLISIYGQAIDGHWFSKLEASIDEDKRTIDLRASSGFYKDWIQRNYEQTMDRIASTMGMKIEISV